MDSAKVSGQYGLLHSGDESECQMTRALPKVLMPPYEFNQHSLVGVRIVLCFRF